MDVSDEDLASRLRQAVTRGDITVAKRLLKGGVDPKAMLWYESTLLHEAVAQKNIDLVKLLIQARVPVNAKDKAGRVALHLACRFGSQEIVETLLRNKARVNIPDHDGRTALHVAAWRGHIQISCLLLQSGANTNIKDQDGWTALHWAAKSALNELVTEMVNHGAHVNVTNKLGQTPLDLCLKYNADVGLISNLIQAGADLNKKPKQNMSAATCPLLQPNCSSEAVSLLMKCGYPNVPSIHGNPAALRTLMASDKTKYNILMSEKITIPPLSKLCRNKIRRTLSEIHPSRKFLGLVNRLPLPPLLRDIISLKIELQDT